MEVRKIVSFAIAFAIAMSAMPKAGANVSLMDSGAKILRVEYQGEELSRDRANPTQLGWEGSDIFFALFGNSASTALDDINNMDLNCMLDGFNAGCGYTAFDSDGRSFSSVSNPSGAYVGNDIFELYWVIRCVTERGADYSRYSDIPGSESPVYYVKFGCESADYAVSPGEVPDIIRVEMDGVELSTDRDNPTIVPYDNVLKLVGNTACISKRMIVWTYYHGVWSRTGNELYFNSNAISSTWVSAPWNEGGRQQYNEIVELGYAIHEEDNHDIVRSKSPTYYAIFLEGDIVWPDAEEERPSPWAEAGVGSAIRKGFVPDALQSDYSRVITRAEFCLMAVKWLEYTTGQDIDAILAENQVMRDPFAFTDTQDSDILAAYALGITNGIGGGRFAPGGEFTREQAATMVRNTCRAAGMEVGNIAPVGFEDIESASSWAVESIHCVRNAEIMVGTRTTPLLFSPRSAYTREQSILTFNNIKG